MREWAKWESPWTERASEAVRAWAHPWWQGGWREDHLSPKKRVRVYEYQVLARRRSDFLRFSSLSNRVSWPSGKEELLREEEFQYWPLKFLSQDCRRKVDSDHDPPIMTPPSLLKGISERKKLNLEITFPSVWTFINQNKILEVNRNRTNKHGQN